MSPRVAIIVGAGPAGLTAAWEFLDRTDIRPIVLESSMELGGISRTVRFKGNRMDIGGHRFFSKSDRVMNWWQNILPLQGAPARDDRLLGRAVPLAKEARRRTPGLRQVGTSAAPDPEQVDDVLLVRERLSRIFWRRRFLKYPVTLEWQTLRNLGIARTAKVGASYLLTRLRPARQERSLEDFFINRFGVELYRTFFRDYTQKVWGVPCSQIKPEWGAQRIKGLSITQAVLHALGAPFRAKDEISQKGTETSLIERFLYPKLGPGQMWEEVARQVVAHGGEIRQGRSVTGVVVRGRRVVAVDVTNQETGEVERLAGDLFVSSMPVRDLIAAVGEDAPANVRQVAAGLVYRDFITVGLLVKKLKIHNQTAIRTVNDVVPDNWIYVQEADVQIGRLQVFNNWSPYLVENPETVWLGLEYFCNEGDELWTLSDEAVSRFAVGELAKLDIVDPADVVDSCVIRVPKTYPAYFGTYDRFPEVRAFTDGIENLFLVGRNGMHRYNNQDHSMLTAMVAVDNISAGISSRSNLWDVNLEDDYHERK